MAKFRVHFRPFYSEEKPGSLTAELEGEVQGLAHNGKFVIIGVEKEKGISNTHIINAVDILYVETIKEGE